MSRIQINQKQQAPYLKPLYGPDNISKGAIISEEWNNVELAAQLLKNLG